MNSMSNSLVKAGGASVRIMALIIALPAAVVIALFAGEWNAKAQSVLTAAAAIGQAFGEAVVKEAPGLARLLVAGDTDAAANVLLKLGQILKEGSNKQNTMLSE